MKKEIGLFAGGYCLVVAFIYAFGISVIAALSFLISRVFTQYTFPEVFVVLLLLVFVATLFSRK